MERISSPKKMMMRSFAIAINMAPEADTIARTWNSAPCTPPRRRKPSATRALSSMAIATNMVTRTLKPSITTACLT